MRTVVQRQTDGHGVRIHVDVAGYRAKRREALAEASPAGSPRRCSRAARRRRSSRCRRSTARSCTTPSPRSTGSPRVRGRGAPPPRGAPRPRERSGDSPMPTHFDEVQRSAQDLGLSGPARSSRPAADHAVDLRHVAARAARGAPRVPRPRLRRRPPRPRARRALPRFDGGAPRQPAAPGSPSSRRPIAHSAWKADARGRRAAGPRRSPATRASAGAVRPRRRAQLRPPAVTAECARRLPAGLGASLVVSEPPDGTSADAVAGRSARALGLGPADGDSHHGTASAAKMTSDAQGPVGERWPRQVGSPPKRPLWTTRRDVPRGTCSPPRWSIEGFT